MATRLDEGAIALKQLLDRQSQFEGEHAYTQMLAGGAFTEAEQAIARLEEVGQVLVWELTKMSELYQRLAG